MKRFLVFLFIFVLGIVSTTATVLLYPEIQKALASPTDGWITNQPLENPLNFLLSLPKSSKKKTTPVPYALPGDALGIGGNAPVLQDMNGDGLPDIFFSYGRKDAPYDNAYQWLLLNTGNGFTMVYGCYANGNSTSGQTYSGDCADYN